MRMSGNTRLPEQHFPYKQERKSGSVGAMPCIKVDLQLWRKYACTVHRLNFPVDVYNVQERVDMGNDVLLYAFI